MAASAALAALGCPVATPPAAAHGIHPRIGDRGGIKAANGYVANFRSGTVSVISLATNRVTATIGGFNQPEFAASTPNGANVYIGDRGGIKDINTATNTIKATITGFNQVGGMAVTPDGTRLYASDIGDRGGVNGVVNVIDTAANRIVKTITDMSFVSPCRVDTHPNGIFAYVTNCASETVSVINIPTNTVATIIPVGAEPEGVQITPDGKFGYVANRASNTVTVIDAATNTFLTTIAGLNGPGGLRITPNSRFVYVANRPFVQPPPPVQPFSAPSPSVSISPIPRSRATAPEANAKPNTNPVPMVNALANTNTVSVIDTSTNMIATTITDPSFNFPFWIAITSDGLRAYATNSASNTVSVIDLATNKVITTIPVGDGPEGMALAQPPVQPPVLPITGNRTATLVPVGLTLTGIGMALLAITYRSARRRRPSA